MAATNGIYPIHRIRNVKPDVIEPLGEIVLVRRETPDAVTASGLEIPETAREKSPYCLVEAISEEAKNNANRRWNVGDRVIVGATARGQGVGPREDGIFLMHQSELLAVARQP
jgi:co-chaperonin GroES (HSP10)